jgi:adenylylsulfate kinase
MCDLVVNHIIVDFVCPFESYRYFYDMKIWMNTIDKGRFEDTNKVFEKPKKVDFEIKDFNYDNIIKEIHDRLL